MDDRVQCYDDDEGNAATDAPKAQQHYLVFGNGDILSRILSFLRWDDMVSCRRVGRAWKDAVNRTPVKEEFHVNRHNCVYLEDVAICLQQLRRIRIEQTSEFQVTENDIIRICSLFQNVTHFICRHASQITRFCLLPSSVLEDTATNHLQKLTHLNLSGNDHMEWKLSDLHNLPQLKSLRCINNFKLTGDLKDVASYHTNSINFTTIDVNGCHKVTGNLLDLCHLSKLKWMGLSRTAVKGDLREVRSQDFLALQMTGLPDAIYGAREIDFVHDAPAVMKVRHQWMKQSNEECPIWPFRVCLSRTSPQYHERIEQRLYSSGRDPPFNIELVKIGTDSNITRRGWRWSNYLGGVCQVHWLDPDPKLLSKENPVEYSIYLGQLEKLRKEEKSSLFSDFLDPPTPSEYEQLCLLEETSTSHDRNRSEPREGEGDWNLHEDITIPDLG